MLVVVPRFDRLRSAAEDAIQTLYWKRYNAILATFAPTIVAELDSTGGIACAAGLRFGYGLLYLENYLNLPVEQFLELHVADAVSRDRVVEVCHLASPDPGRSLSFVHKLIEMLRAMRTEWAIFTATKLLRSLLQRSGLPMLELARAERARVSDSEMWGSYFEHDPRIMAVGHRFNYAPKRFTPPFAATRVSADARVL